VTELFALLLERPWLASRVAVPCALLSVFELEDDEALRTNEGSCGKGRPSLILSVAK
jgi:hypothetical protein